MNIHWGARKKACVSTSCYTEFGTELMYVVLVPQIQLLVFSFVVIACLTTSQASPEWWPISLQEIRVDLPYITCI